MRYSELSLFNGIPEEDCPELAECLNGRLKRFAAGEAAAVLGGANPSVGVIVLGSAELLRIDEDGNRTVLEFLGRDDLFGETIAFSAPYDSVEVVSLTDSEVLFLELDGIMKRCGNACEKHTRLVENLFRLMAEKSRALSSRLEVLSSRTIREKLMSFFRQTALKHGSNRFPLPFSMTTLADYISADRSATARELKKMREDNLVKIDKKQVTLLGNCRD